MCSQGLRSLPAWERILFLPSFGNLFSCPTHRLSGLGRMIAEAKNTPIVLPIHIRGALSSVACRPGGGWHGLCLTQPARLTHRPRGCQKAARAHNQRRRECGFAAVLWLGGTRVCVCACPRPIRFIAPSSLTQFSAFIGEPLDLEEQVAMLRETYGANTVSLSVCVRGFCVLLAIVDSFCYNDTALF